MFEERVPIKGPSPRVRGNPPSATHDPCRIRTIPAGAGEPALDCRQERPVRDHPRGCGGTPARPTHCAPGLGPSPRVRGNLGVDR